MFLLFAVMAAERPPVYKRPVHSAYFVCLGTVSFRLLGGGA